jgi:restriction system protein
VILKFYEYFIPVLVCLKEKGPLTTKEIRADIVKRTDVSPEDLLITSEKGTNIYTSRIHWATQYLFHSEALTRPETNIYQISNVGENLLKRHPLGLSLEDLKETEGYKKWDLRTTGVAFSETKVVESGESPQEIFDQALSEIEGDLKKEIVSRIQSMKPIFLERLVLRLLGSMGYGTDNASLVHSGKPGDEGIDGFINQDKLGIQKIYIQAKRNQDGGTVGRKELQSFAGAIIGKGGIWGVFIATSDFTKEAREYVKDLKPTKIILINGVDLGEHLIEQKIGVVLKKTYNLLEIDEYFFNED